MSGLITVVARNRLWRITMFVAASLLACHAQAESDEDLADAAVATHNAKDASDNKVICKRIRITGSHFKKKVCQSAAQWDAQRAEAQEEARRMSSQGGRGIAGEGS